MDERGSFIFMTNLKKQILLTFFICFFWVLNAQSIASYRLPLSNDGAGKDSGPVGGFGENYPRDCR